MRSGSLVVAILVLLAAGKASASNEINGLFDARSGAMGGTGAGFLGERIADFTLVKGIGGVARLFPLDVVELLLGVQLLFRAEQPELHRRGIRYGKGRSVLELPCDLGAIDLA